MKKPKLIVSDIDGTLIPYGYGSLPRELAETVRELRRRGIIFCPASGRQYHSMRVLFREIADEIYYISENGGAVYSNGPEESAKLISKTEMPRDTALQIGRDISSIENTYVIISGIRSSYILSETESLFAGPMKGLGNKLTVVDRVEDIEEPIVKLAAYCPVDLNAAGDILRPKWADKVNMACAGPTWWDFTLADKGKGLFALMSELGIESDEVAAFGDNWNDAPMLRVAGRPYIMESASGELRAMFRNVCSDVLEKIRELTGIA